MEAFVSHIVFVNPECSKIHQQLQFPMPNFLSLETLIQCRAPAGQRSNISRSPALRAVLEPGNATALHHMTTVLQTPQPGLMNSRPKEMIPAQQPQTQRGSREQGS